MIYGVSNNGPSVSVDSRLFHPRLPPKCYFAYLHTIPRYDYFCPSSVFNLYFIVLFYAFLLFNWNTSLMRTKPIIVLYDLLTCLVKMHFAVICKKRTWTYWVSLSIQFKKFGNSLTVIHNIICSIFVDIGYPPNVDSELTSFLLPVHLYYSVQIQLS